MKFFLKQIISLFFIIMLLSQAAMAEGHSWTGYYTGGAYNNNWNSYYAVHQPSDNGRIQTFKKIKQAFSLFTGYGYEFQSHLYLGATAGFQYNFDSSLSNNQFDFPSNIWGNVDASIAPQYSIYFDLTPGYAITDSWLIYGILGTSFTDYDLNYGYKASEWNKKTQGGRDATFMSSSDYSIAIRLGAGIKYKITEHLVTSFSYIYSYGSPMNATYFVNGSFLSLEQQSIRPTTQSITIALAYQF